jgi:hypothetical protein
MSRAGGKDYVKISKAEQNRLMSLPSRGKLFQELANKGSACIVEEPNLKKKSKSTGAKPIVRRRRMRNKLSSGESSISDSRTESEGMNFIIAFDNFYQAYPVGLLFFFQTLRLTQKIYLYPSISRRRSCLLAEVIYNIYLN